MQTTNYNFRHQGNYDKYPVSHKKTIKASGATDDSNEQGKHYLLTYMNYLYLNSDWAGPNSKVCQVVLKWVWLSPVSVLKHAFDMGSSEVVIFIAD